MKTKVLLTLTVLVFSTSLVMSQGLGVLGGLNLQNITGKDYDGDKLENDLKPGFHIGVNYQIPIAPEFYFQPGLLFTTKGAKNTEGDEDVTINLNYLELPLSLVYKGALGNGKIYLGLGPYLAYGIGGKMKVGDNEEDITFKNKVTEDDGPGNYFKALDFGGNIFVGYELEQGLFLQLNTQLGMTDLMPEYEGEGDLGEMKMKNTGFGLSVGFRF